MHTEIVDIYQCFGQAAPQGAVGRLSCYWADTPQAVSPCRKKPAMLVLPGGGYHHTSHREHESVALQLLARGFSVFVLEYSVAPLRFPVALREAAFAMRFIRENAGRFGADSAMVAAMGFSAGGHLCGTLGTLFDAPEVADIAPASVLRPDALGLCYPVAVSHGNTHAASFDNLCGEDAALRARLSLDALARPDMPPAFIWHTRSDESVPCRNSLLLALALEAQGVDFSLRIYRLGSHGVSTADEHSYAPGQLKPISPDVPGWLDSLVLFLREKGIFMKDEGEIL